MAKIKLMITTLALILIQHLTFGVNPPDEGMWLPMLVDRLNYTDMQKAGLKLTAEELYSINRSSLKDAIVQFGGGCTGEVVSSQGLLFTNHHCGYDYIQKHSSVDRDYLTNGFWAYSKTEELPNRELTVTFLVRMDDVTSKVLNEVTEKMSEPKRQSAIESAINKLKKTASEKGKYTVEIKPFFEGNEYYMFVYEVYTDVRLVGAPPSAIGKFGGDTDNWMWPRHTGDFSIFRIYCAPDGSPREYHKENVPYTPKHYLPINIKGVKKNDFAMIWGYPGVTDRYLSSYGVTEILEQQAPAIISLREQKLKIMKSYMDADHAIQIQYSSKYAETANYWKYFIGQSKGLKQLNVQGKKKAQETEFEVWVKSNPAHTLKYGTVLKDIETGVRNSMDKLVQKRLWYLQETLTGAEALYLVYKMNDMARVLQKKKANPEDFKPFREIASEFFKNFHMPLDRDIFAAMMSMYHSEMPVQYQPDILPELVKKHNGDFAKIADETYENSIFVSAKAFDRFLKRPKLKVWENDPIVKMATSLIGAYYSLQSDMSSGEEKFKKAKRLYIAGILEMNGGKKHYPDANFTMRMTYGKVMDYSPSDGINYHFLSTEQGILEKADSTNEEFVVPKKLLDLIKAKDFGRYGKEGHLPICFIANTDITGGNSGSPVINAEGHYVGSAFDGNWEAMSGDISFEPSMQRTIVVDARYVLFIIDKYAGAKNLIDELKIIE